MPEGEILIESYDVAVIGASVMGSYAAERMARAGLRVALLEKDPFPGKSTVCAGGMHVDVQQFLRIPASVVDRDDCSFQIRLGPRIHEWSFPHPAWLTVSRRLLDQEIAGRAQAAGAHLFVLSRVVDVRPEDGLLLFQHRKAKDLRTLRARVFVFADGVNSLARRLGRMTADRGLRWAAVAWDLSCSPSELPVLEFHLDAAFLPFGYAWVFPKGTHLDVGLMRLTALPGPPLPLLLQEFIQGNPQLRDRKVLVRRGGIIPASIPATIQGPNWMAVGDAAGMVNPITGGGYMSGLSSAALAADACVEAFANGGFNPRVLSRYRRRLRTGKHYLNLRLTNLLLRLMRRVHALFGVSFYPTVFLAYEWMIQLAIRSGFRFLRPPRRPGSPR